MAKFTKAHFESIAEVLYNTRPMPEWGEDRIGTWRVTVARFARVFKQSNARFDSIRFYRACGATSADFAGV